MTYALLVRFHLRDGCAADFDALAAETIDAIATREPETLTYGSYAPYGLEGQRVFIEVYTDREAHASHERQAHTQRFLAQRAQFVESFEVEEMQGIVGSVTCKAMP